MNKNTLSFRIWLQGCWAPLQVSFSELYKSYWIIKVGKKSQRPSKLLTHHHGHWLISLSATFPHFLNSSRDSDFTTSSLGSLLQYITTLSRNNFFLIPNHEPLLVQLEATIFFFSPIRMKAGKTRTATTDKHTDVVDWSRRRAFGTWGEVFSFWNIPVLAVVPFDIWRNERCSHRDRVFHRWEQVISKNIYPTKTKSIKTVGRKKKSI